MPLPAPALSGPVEIIAMATERHVNFKPRVLQRRPVGANDVLISLRFCGICHTDVHMSKDDVDIAMPRSDVLVPGHELAGVVSAVGVNVSRFKIGDHVGVGCLVGSCGECKGCRDGGGEQPFCPQKTMTYAEKDVTKAGIAATYPKGGFTLGGYCNATVVHEDFVVLIPKSYPLEFAGPVMCAGVTVYSPLMNYGAGKGTRVGIVGPGGLGCMAIKIAKALGCIVTAITTQANKTDFLTKECGADYVIVSTSVAEMSAARKTRSLDLIIDCCTGGDRDIFKYEPLLARDGHMCLVGFSDTMVAAMLIRNMCAQRARLRMSMIGGIRQTQEVIDLCAKHKIFPTTKIIGVEEINKAFGSSSLAGHASLPFSRPHRLSSFFLRHLNRVAR